jgi:hypothetical protein
MPIQPHRPLISACSTLIPTLLLPALLLAATPAAAALTVGAGSLTAKQPTTVGFDFTLELHGTLTHNGVARPTSITLTCSVHTAAERLACDGTLAVQGSTAALRMDFFEDTASWSVAGGASTLLNIAHAQWGEEVVTNTMSVPQGWSAVDFLAGGQWRRFYYSSSWAVTFESITGMPYSEVTEIWTW